MSADGRGESSHALDEEQVAAPKAPEPRPSEAVSPYNDQETEEQDSMPDFA